MDFAAMKRRDLQALCKRHGLPAGGTNADLVALLDAALPGAAGPEEELATRKGCLKRSDGNGEAKKVTFALEQEAEASGRKLRSRVIWSPVAVKSTGGHKAGEEAPPEKKVRGRGRPRKLVEVPAAADGVAGEAGDDAPATRSRRNAGKSGAVDGVESGNDSSVAEEKAEEVVRESTDRKRKRNTQGNAEDIAFGLQDGVSCNAQVGVSRRVTRRSSLSGAAVLLPLAVDRKRGRRNARDGKGEELDAETQAAKGQDFAAAASSVIVESTRSRRKGEVCVPAALRSSKVEESGRTTRSRSIASAVMLPTDVENKRRKTEYVHPDGKPPTVSEVPRNDAPVTRLLRNRVVQVNSSVVDRTVSEVPKIDTSSTRWLRNRDVQVNNSVVEPTVLGVPRNDAPVTRSLRNRVVQINNSVVGPTVLEMPRNDGSVTRSLRNRVVEVNNSVVEETHVSKKLENKRQPSGPATCTHQQLASSLEEEDQEQVASPSKYPPLRRSVRNHSDVSNAIVESNKLIRVPVEDKDLNIAGPLVRHSAKGKDVEKQPSVKESVRRSTRNSVAPTMLEKEKDLIAENKPDAHVRRSTRKSVLPAIDTKDVGDKVQNAKGEDVAKQPAVQEHVRRSTCKSVVSAMLEKEENDLNAEKNPEAHVRRSIRKSVVPAVDIKADEIQNGKGKDVEKQPAIKEPVRRSTRKSIVSAVNEEDKDLNAEKNPEANGRKSKRKSVVVAKDIKSVGDAMAEDVEKQPAVKQPVKHSSRKSVLPGTLENEGGLLVVETNAESRASRSKQKCVLANRLDKDSQDHSKVARNEDFQSGKVVGEEKQLKVIEPVRRTRQSVATMVLEKQTNGLHEKKLEIPMRRSTRKSVTLNAVGKGGRDDTEMVGREQSPVGTRNLKASSQLTDPAVSITASENKLQQEVVQDNQGLRRSARKSLEHNLSDDDKTHPCPDKYMSCERMGEGLKRKRRRDSKDISSPANDSWNTEAFGGTKFRKQQNTQSPNEECNVGSGADHEKPQRSQHVSNSTASKGTPAKQRSTTAPEENISVDKTKSDDMVIREATQDGDKVALECSKESNSRDRDQENCQINATGEELSSAPLHVLLPEETYIVQTVHEVVPESESGDVDKSSENPESSDKCKQVREHSNTQADDNHACDTRIEGLDESTNIVELVPHTGIVTENETLIDEGEVILGANHIQIVKSESGDVDKSSENPESSDKCKEVREHSKTQADDNHACDTRIGGLDESTNIVELVPHTGIVTENETLIDEGEGILGANHMQIVKSESGDVDKSSENPESSDKCKQVWEHSNTQADDNHACDTRIGGLDESTNIVELVPHTGIVTENETLIDEGEVILGANHIQIVNSGCDVVGLEGLDKSVDIAQETASTTAVLILEANTPIDEGTTVNAETIKQFDEEVASTISSCCDDTTVTVAKPQFAGQSDNQDASADDVLPIDSTVGGCQEQCPVSHVAGQESNIPEANASESREANLVDVMSTGLHAKDIVPTNSTIKGQEEQYPVSLVAVEKGVSEEANATESAGKTLAGIMLTGLHTKDLHRDYDVLTKETSEDSKQEFHSEVIADESIKDVDTGKCLSKGNSPSTNLHSEGATDDSILPALNAANGCSPNGGCSSFGLCLVAGECKKSYYRNGENTTVEEVCGNKPRTCVTPKFSVGPDSGLGDEDVQPLGYNADKKLDEDQGIAQEEFSEKKSNDEHVDAIIYPETKLNDEIAGLYMESKLVADCPDDKQAMVQAQQSGIQEGTLEKPSLQSATPERKHECVPEEAVLHLMKNKGCLSTAEQSPFGVQCLFSQGSIDECMGYGTPGSATAHIENEDGKLKDCHVKCAKKSPVSEPVSRHDTHEGDCMYSSQQDNGTEGMLKASDEERFFSGPSDANDMGMGNPICRVINSEEVACKGEGNKKLVHSEDLNTSCEKSAINGLGASSEEAVHTMKNYATCLSNPKQLLMELQSLYSKENVEDSSSHDGLASPGPERGGDESTVCHVEQQVSVPLGFNLSRLESIDTLDVSVGCLDTEVLHQGHKDPCNKDKEKQVASISCTSDIVEAATAKYVESGVAPLPAELSNSKDEQLNPVLEGSKPVQSGLNRDKVVSNNLDNGSAVSIVGKRTPCGSSLGKGSSTDHYLEQELLDDFCMGKSLEGFAMFGDKSDCRVGTIQNPSFGSATPDHKPEGALCEEAAHKMENYVGTCSSNPRELLMGLQSLFSEESIVESDRCNSLIFPIAETGEDESTVSRVAKVAETLVSLECDTYQGPRQDFSRAEDKDDSMFVSLQDNEQEGFLESSHVKERITCTQFDLQENAQHKEWYITPEEVLCEEREKRKSMPTSDCNIHEKSHSNGGICQSSGRKLIEENNSMLSCYTEVHYQDHKEECNERNEDMVTPGVPENHISETASAPVEETSELPDEQLKPKLYGDDSEEHRFSCDKNRKEIFFTGSVMNDLFHLSKDCLMDSDQEQEVTYNLCVPTPEESADYQDERVLGSEPCQTSGHQCIQESSTKQLTCNIGVLNQDNQECNENSEDQISLGIPASGMSDAAQIGRPEGEIAQAPVAGTSALPDQPLNSNLECKVEEYSCKYDKDTCMNLSSEYNLPTDLSAPRSPGVSTIFQNDIALGAVGQASPKAADKRV